MGCPCLISSPRIDPKFVLWQSRISFWRSGESSENRSAREEDGRVCIVSLLEMKKALRLAGASNAFAESGWSYPPDFGGDYSYCGGLFGARNGPIFELCDWPCDCGACFWNFWYFGAFVASITYLFSIC